ncbi:ribosome binding protein [Babesia ovata]|uniref:Ribosome binding protein n=1 Tax=Babesia ovata TaxID=189622 RepID=A0A2H6KG37_9APIC|nr:ribosome binding protein [Babesia ovata]GBE61956.1 ribosome binding protein [Babesia ovata]
MAKHGIPLGTLKECLMFLEWLNHSKHMRDQVAKELHDRLSGRYLNPNQQQIQQALTTFLGNVSTFHNKLCNKASQKHISSNPTAVLDALSECIPKFLAVMYFLRYQVDASFSKLDGGKWKDHMVGQGILGRELQAYLTTSSGSKYGVIPGGFGRHGDVKRGSGRNGYRQGSDMASDLTAICEKHSNKPNIQNYFLDVFSTSVLGQHGTDLPNTANALALVRTFCEIVVNDKGGELISKLNAHRASSDKHICWNNLKAHCEKLQEQFSKIFKGERFSFTGFGREPEHLKKEEFAKEAADWLRDNLDKVKTNLGNIDTTNKALGKKSPAELTDYFNKYLFPYGFTFDKNNFGSGMNPHDVLSGVINDLKRGDDGLDKLKQILEGEVCPPEKQEEGAQDQGKKAEGAQNQGKKSEGAQDQGKKAEASPNQNNGQSRDASADSASGDSSAPAASPGAPGAAGPAGPKNDRGQQGPPGSGPPVSSPAPGLPVIQAVQTQRTDDTVSAVSPPPPPPAPPLPKDPGHTAQPGDPGAGSPGGDGQGAQPGGSPVTSPTQPTSASDSQPGPTGGQGSGRHDSGVAGQDVGQASGKTPSSGATPSGAPAAGGGGGKGQQDPPKPIPCRNVTLQNLLAGGNNWCPSTYKPPNQVPYKFSDPDALNKIHEKVKNESHSASQNLNTPDILQNQNNSGHLTFGHSLKPTRLRPGDRLPTPPPQEKPSVLSGSEVEENEAYPMIMNDEYSDAISLEGNAKFDNSRDYRQLDEEQRGQELDDQWKKYYGDQELVNRLDRMKHDMELRQAKIKELQHARTVHDHKEQLRLEAVNSLAKSGTISGTAIERDHIVVPTSKSTKPQPTFIISKNHSLPTVKLDDYSMAKFTDVTGTVLTQSPKMKTKDTVSLPAPPTPYVTGKSIDDNNIDSLTSSYPVGELHPARPPPVDVEIVRPPASPNKSKAYRTMGVPPVELIDQPRPPMPSARKTYRNDAENLQTMVYFDKSNPEKHSTTITLNTMADLNVCQNPWYAPPSSSSTTVTPAPSPPPGSDHLPPPNTVREMLHWLVGLNQKGYVGIIKEHVKGILSALNEDVSQPPDALEVTGHPTNLTAAHVTAKLTEACHYAANVLHRIKHKDISTDISVPDFTSEYSKLCYSIDPACLLCQLRDYVYACCHQLEFLKAQCNRKESEGGWQDCPYGRDAKMSPLQAFLTDAPDSKFETHPFDPCDICLKSRVNMGFKQEHLPATHETGKHISTILTPSCGGEDPLLTLTSYLTCITSRTPRTTGELVSFFHNFGNSLYKPHPHLSQLGSALSKPHDHCPDWDHLAADDLNAIQYIRGPAPPTANHDKGHSRTLSTLVGCDITNAQCPPHISSTTYRAYALYSSSFAHAYLSWAVYLADRLWESLLKLHYDLENLQCHDSKSKPLHQCTKALPLLYSHGITPPDGTVQSSLTCSAAVTKLKDVVNGKPIARLMTAMDLFLYRIRAPFLYTIIALWLTATLCIAHSLLYRMDVMHIRSHLLTTRASHNIDVKALLAGSRRMLSLYKDVDYFDDDFHS